ncbi:MAG: hypothetical protein ACYC18_13620 [Gammaproteobacteria bacterium]
MNMVSRRMTWFAPGFLAVALLVTAGTHGAWGHEDGDNDATANIATALVSAPVVSNGIVAGAPTEINLFLNAPGIPNRLAFDATHFGHQIPAGGWMEVKLGGSFQRNGVDNGLPFVPINSNAFFILTTGHPQDPIVAAAGAGVQHGNYLIMDSGNKVIKIVPNGGNGENGLENARADQIGFKVIHVRPGGNGSGPAPFTNGPAGSTGTVTVRIYDSKGEQVEYGKRAVEFMASVGRQVFVTNDGLVTGNQGSPASTTAELVESTNFQHVAPGSMLVHTAKAVPFSAGAPYAPRFLLFEAAALQPNPFIPQRGIAGVGYIVDAHHPWRARLVQDSNGNGKADAGDQVIGRIVFKGPGGSSRGQILPSDVLTTSGDGVTGANGSVLSVPVQMGSHRGVYQVKVSLNRGGKAVNTIIVQ